MGKQGIAFRMVSEFMIVLSYFLLPVLRLLWPKQQKQLLPRTNNPLFSLSASQITQRIRQKKVTCVEVVSTFVLRLTEVNPILNAIVEDRFVDALKDAAKVDEFLASTTLTEEELKKSKPLLGLPVTIKENLSLKGLSYAVGSSKRAGIKAEVDGDCVLQLKEAGAIPLCVTNTPEYCLSMETYNFITGATNNPYNTLYNSGGSSGGEGSLIGSGASVCGLGSDIAGSIRIPSAFNGIFGHKISPGMISLNGHFPMSTNETFQYHLTIGPMVRYSEDLPLLTKILVGKNADKLKLDEQVNLSDLNVLYMEDCGSNFGMLKVQDEIKAAIRKSVRHLKEECKSTVVDVKFDQMKNSAEIGVIMHFSYKNVPYVLEDENVGRELLKSFFGKSRFPFNTLLYGMAEQNKTMIPGNPEDTGKEVDKLKEQIMKELGQNGVLIFPSYPTSAVPHYGAIYGTIGANYLMIINVLGLPSTNVPVGFDGKGLPIGIQVVAAPNQDRLCFAVAKELETLFGGWKPPY